jgi:hypothetical protein
MSVIEFTPNTDFDFANPAQALRAAFRYTAEWRHMKALEYPDDPRNLKAAERLEHLAMTVGRIEPDLLAAYADLWSDPNQMPIEEENELLRRVGFKSFPETASEFVSTLLFLHRRAV